MTNRYAELLASIAATDEFILKCMLYVLALIITYLVLEWVPVFFRRFFKWLYLLYVLAAFIFVTVYFPG